jgi:uncharacterized protein (TIGR03435 family)
MDIPEGRGCIGRRRLKSTLQAEARATTSWVTIEDIMLRELLAALLGAVAIVNAQSFEVASIKPAAMWKTGGEGSGRSRIEYSRDSLTMRNVDLKECVQWAYGVEYYQIPAPNALDGTSYYILAKAAGAVPVSQLRLMLQQLLADRFKLTLHHETKPLPVYALTVAKGGPKLPAKNDVVDHAMESLPRVQDGSFLFPEASMTEFATKLSLLRGMDRPVVDQTGITGFFDIVLKGAADAVRNPEGGASLFTLVQEQLGLKLVTTKAPVEIVVIDHAEKPSEN